MRMRFDPRSCWSWSVFIAVSFPLQRQTAANENCTLCVDGAGASLISSGTLPGGMPCQELPELLQSIPSGTESCETWQVQGFMHCGCPSRPAALSCSMCANDEFQIPVNRRFREIPLLTLPAESTCIDSLFTRQSTGYCAEYQRAAYFCGCPNAPSPVCNAVCQPPLPAVALEDTSTSPVTSAADRLLPPYFDLTCQDMYTQSTFYWPEDECSAFQDPVYSLIDEFTYCCSNDMPPQPPQSNSGTSSNGCDLCSGIAVVQPDRLMQVSEETGATISCQDLQMLSFVVTDDVYCDSFFMQNQKWIDICCLGLSEEPSTSPSGAPTVKTSSIPTIILSDQPSTVPSEAEEEQVSNIENDAKSSASFLWGYHNNLEMFVVSFTTAALTVLCMT